MEEEKKQNVETKESAKEKQEQIEEKRELSDDELYAKIQTEKLLKKKKVRKIITLSTLCVAFAMAVCLIVLAVVPVSLKPKCAVGGFSSVELYHGNIVSKFDNNNMEKDKFNLFMQKYNESFNTTYLSAIFSGSLFSYSISEDLLGEKPSGMEAEEYEEGFVPEAFSSSNQTYYARLEFDKYKTFIKQDGTVFLSKYSAGKTSAWDGSLTYKYIYMGVNEKKSSQVSFYILGRAPYKKSDSEMVNYHLITVKVKADTSPIYSVWSDFVA